MNKKDFDLPLNQRPLLSINEAAFLFHIGKNKLREMIAENPKSKYLLHVGRGKTLIKREEFEKYLKNSFSI